MILSTNKEYLDGGGGFFLVSQFLNVLLLGRLVPFGTSLGFDALVRFFSPFVFSIFYFKSTAMIIYKYKNVQKKWLGCFFQVSGFVKFSASYPQVIERCIGIYISWFASSTVYMHTCLNNVNGRISFVFFYTLKPTTISADCMYPAVNVFID